MKIPEIDIKIESCAVTATPRKLKARWHSMTPEEEQSERSARKERNERVHGSDRLLVP